MLTARRGKRLEALASELQSRHGISAETLVADLADPAETDHLAERIGRIDSLAMLVHSAGFGTLDSFAGKDVEFSVAMVEVHDVVALRLTHAALPAMKARRQGAIIHVSSIAAFGSGPANVTYGATKAFLNVFCEGLQAELAGTGVRVQALCPGLTRTEFHDTPEYRGFNRGRIPRSFWMTADEVVVQSLRALDSGQVVVIPGLKNRLFVELIRYGSIRAVARKVLARLRSPRVR